MTYQCYNTTSVGLTHDFVDVESTSSDSENELKQLEILLEEKKKKVAEAAGVWIFMETRNLPETKLDKKECFLWL